MKVTLRIAIYCNSIVKSYTYVIASAKIVFIGEFHASENILITFLIVLMSLLDALVVRKNVLQPMEI